MPSPCSRTVLLALLACVQLVLAPAFRPGDCGDRGGMSGGCCLPEVRVAVVCCCGDEATPDQPGPPADDGGDQPCGCSLSPQPVVPVEDVALPVPAGPVPVQPALGSGVRMPSPVLAERGLDADAGPPGGGGPTLFLLHCALLI